MSFKFRPILTVCAIAGISTLLALGTWQIKRLAWKNDLVAKVEARLDSTPISLAQALTAISDREDIEYQPVTLTGEFEHDKEAHVFGIYDKVPGYFIMTPLATGDASYVYINRGFVVEANKEPSARRTGQVKGQVTVVGLYRAPEERPAIANAVAVSNNPDANQWYIRAPQDFAKHYGIKVMPFIIDSTQTVEGGPKGGTTRVSFNNRHMEYALTWYGLAAALFGVFLAFSFQRKS